MAVLIAFLIYCSGGWLLRQYDLHKTEQGYEQLKEAVTADLRQDETIVTDETEPEEYVPPVDFVKLAQMNPDVVGWLYIPGTGIDYPIVQTEDNETYLQKDFMGNKAQAGAVFLDYVCPPQMDGQHQILYGHHMRDGSMFHDLDRFLEKDFLEQHKYFVIYTPEKAIYLKALACYCGAADAEVRQMEFADSAGFHKFVQERLRSNRYKVQEPVQNSLFTFITCNYDTEDGRTYLYSTEVLPEEIETARQAVEYS